MTILNREQPERIRTVDGISTITYPATDVAGAKALFSSLLGTDPYVDEAYYVGFRVADQEIGLDRNERPQGVPGPIGYCNVDDIRSRLQSLLSAGAEPHQDVKDVGGGKLTATVKDSAGNIIGLIQSP